MCGIIGILSDQNIVSDLITSLEKLEYRGYDSSGIAIIDEKEIKVCKEIGKLDALKKSLSQRPLNGNIGIGHTRWATHGSPTRLNAHPHYTQDVAVVHNGIIENYKILKSQLESQNYVFQSETDTEVITLLIQKALDEKKTFKEILPFLAENLKGAYALAILFKDDPSSLYCMRKGSPLVVGYHADNIYIGSDAIALSPFTRQIIYLQEGDWAHLQKGAINIFDKNHQAVERPTITSNISNESTSKGPYAHFMLKEIFEQPTILKNLIHYYFNTDHFSLNPFSCDIDFKEVTKISLVACGTSYHAAFIAKYWLESFLKLPIDIDIASEFRYRTPYFPEKGMVIFISQSGETIDTLEALRYAKKNNQYCIALVNRTESTMAREAHNVLPLLAGVEIGVASTKAFTAQLFVLAYLCLWMAVSRKNIEKETLHAYIQDLINLPALMQEMLQDVADIKKIAHILSQAKNILYIGRGNTFPLALEGALKLKEISYIHTEGYAAGEMKHGPIALIDQDTPVLVLAPENDYMEKTFSNMQEAYARGAFIFLISNKPYEETSKNFCHLKMPNTGFFSTPVLYSLPIQLIAYYTAHEKKADIDQPRNLAKSVTVE